MGWILSLPEILRSMTALALVRVTQETKVVSHKTVETMVVRLAPMVLNR